MDAYVNGYRSAVKHLFAAGLAPAPCLPELRELWSNSPEDRALVAAITSRWEIQ